MKNKIYEAWYNKNKKEILQKRKDAYYKRKKILNNIRIYQIKNDVEVEEYDEIFHCDCCDITICHGSKWAHFKTTYHKYNEGIYKHPDPETTE